MTDAAVVEMPARLPGSARGALVAHVERILVSDRLSDFADIWPRSADPGAARCHAFQYAEVIEVWLATIGAARNIKPCFVAVLGDDDRPLLLLPLGIETIRGVRLLKFLDGGVSDYNTPILFAPDRPWTAQAFATLWRRIVAALPPFDAAVLEKMPERVADLANPLLLLQTAPYPACGHAITLSGSWPEFEAKRLPRREDGRRKQRKLAKMGAVSFQVAQSPQDVETFFDAMVAYKARKFAETRVPGFESTPGNLEYFREMTRRFVRSGLVHLSALKVGDTVVASHWGLIANGRFYHMMPGYADGEWQRYSPGRLLNDHLIRDSYERNLAVFDFGIGDEAYKHEYCDLNFRLHSFIAGETLAGQVYVRAAALLARLRQARWYQAVRPYKWVLLRALGRSSRA
jgi:CelD/BcsL family acetyltransferase involved in cellulose biosynthesis